MCFYLFSCFPLWLCNSMRLTCWIKAYMIWLDLTWLDFDTAFVMIIAPDELHVIITRPQFIDDCDMHMYVIQDHFEEDGFERPISKVCVEIFGESAWKRWWESAGCGQVSNVSFGHGVTWRTTFICSELWDCSWPRSVVWLRTAHSCQHVRRLRQLQHCLNNNNKRSK